MGKLPMNETTVDTKGILFFFALAPLYGQWIMKCRPQASLNIS